MRWSKEDTDKLIELVKQGKDYDEIAIELNRTKKSIISKMYDIGLHKSGYRSVWTEEDIKEFKDDWLNNKYTVKYIANKYGRSVDMIYHKAWKLGLGSRMQARVDLSITEAAEELGISRITLVRWIEKHGLKTVKNRVGLQKYLINTKDLLKWLEKNQDKFDASKISEYLFINEPKWLIDKRKRDKKDSPNRKFIPWTDNEINTLKKMLDNGKTPGEIAEQLGRTKIAIQKKMDTYDIGKHRQYCQPWTNIEIRILTDNYGKISHEDIAKLLPKRSKNAVSNKICQLKREGILM